MNRLILFLIRRKFGVKKYQLFIFSNQKSKDLYYFDEYSLYKINYNGVTSKSHVSLNWLLDKECFIIKCNN